MKWQRCCISGFTTPPTDSWLEAEACPDVWYFVDLKGHVFVAAFDVNGVSYPLGEHSTERGAQELCHAHAHALAEKLMLFAKAESV